MAWSYVRASDLPQVVPLFPLSGVILLPRGHLPLNIFEPRYLNMVDDAMAGDRIIAMVQPFGHPANGEAPPLMPVGCAGRITSYAETPDGRYLISLSGVCRFRLGDELAAHAPYRQARVDFDAFAGDVRDSGADTPFDRETLLAALKDYLGPRGLDIDWSAASEAPGEALVNSLSMALPFEPAEKQALLEAADTAERLNRLTALLRIDAAEPDDGEPPLMQ